MKFPAVNIHPATPAHVQREVRELVEIADGMMDGLSRRCEITPQRMCMQWAALAYNALPSGARGLIQAGSASWQFCQPYVTDGPTHFSYQFDGEFPDLSIDAPLPEIHAWLVAQIGGVAMFIDLTARYVEQVRDEMLGSTCAAWDHDAFPVFDAFPLAAYAQVSSGYEANGNAIRLTGVKLREWFALEARLSPSPKLASQLVSMIRVTEGNTRKVAVGG